MAEASSSKNDLPLNDNENVEATVCLEQCEPQDEESINEIETLEEMAGNAAGAEHVEAPYSYFVTRTYPEMKETLMKHSEEISNKYCVSRRTKHFGKLVDEIDYKNHSISWQERNITSSDFKHTFFDFDGVPYMIVGMYYMSCQFGNDSQLTRKAKYKKMKEDGKIVVGRERVSTQSVTKKCGCPANIIVKHVVKFPDFKIEDLSTYRKRNTNSKLRESLNQHLQMKMESYFIGRVPDRLHHNHEQLMVSEKKKEPIHKDLIIAAQEMLLQDVKIIKIHAALRTLVVDDWFYQKTPPDPDSRKYFPAKADLRNLGKSIIRLCQFSDNEIELLSDVIDKLQEEDGCANIAFHMENIEVAPGDDNFDADHDDFFSEQPSPKKKKYERKTIPAPPKQYKSFLFLLQSSIQQKLLLRYGTVVFLTELKHNSTVLRALTYRMYLVLVQTNVDYQVVGCLAHSKIKGAVSLADCLQRFKVCNAQWLPKYVLGDCSDEMVKAVEETFPDVEYCFNPIVCRKMWLKFIQTPQNELSAYSDEIMKYLLSMQNSYTKESLTTSASLMEMSEVWKSSECLREWFQTEWLLTAKRWVKAYRPEDLLLFNHGEQFFEETIVLYERCLSNSTFASPQLGTQTGFIKMVDEMARTVRVKEYERYVYLNKKILVQCKHLLHCEPNYQQILGIPLRLVPTYMQIKDELDSKEFEISHEQVGVMKVSTTTVNNAHDNEDVDSHLVIFGSNKNFPSCTCEVWRQDGLPCLHMFAIFKHNKDWKYDSLSLCYRINPALDIDYSSIQVSDLMNTGGSKSVASQTDVRHSQAQNQATKQTQSFQHTIFMSPTNINCTEAMLMKLKNLRNGVKEFAHIFADKQYERVLETDLDLFINGMENKTTHQPATSSLRQANCQFVSMGSLLKSGVQPGSSGFPMKKPGLQAIVSPASSCLTVKNTDVQSVVQTVKSVLPHAKTVVRPAVDPTRSGLLNTGNVDKTKVIVLSKKGSISAQTRSTVNRTRSKLPQTRSKSPKK